MKENKTPKKKAKWYDYIFISGTIFTILLVIKLLIKVYKEYF